MQKVLPFFMSIFLVVSAFAQSYTSDSSFAIPRRPPPGIGPTFGYRGASNHLVELGVTYAEAGHGVVGYDLAYVSNLKKGADHLSGYSFSFFSGFAFIETGINGTLYTNYEKYRLYIRPNMGIGIAGISTLSYGYNFSMGKNVFKEQISPHELRFIIRLPFGII